jgi:polyisoprenoid-binding protein YceI
MPGWRQRAGAWAQVLVLMPVLSLLPSLNWAQPSIYVLDPQHSFVHFEVLHFGTSTTRGRFGPVRGEVLLDPQAGSGELSLRLATSTVNTGLAFFDTRLRQDDLLASAAHPEAFFVSRDFRFASGQLAELRGEFTWRGVSQPLSLRALKYSCRNTAEGGQVCGGDFEAEILRSEFGSTFGLPFVANRVRLVVQVEGQRR